MVSIRLSELNYADFALLCMGNVACPLQTRWIYLGNESFTIIIPITWDIAEKYLYDAMGVNVHYVLFHRRRGSCYE